MNILKSTTSLLSILLSYAAFAQEPALRDLSVEQTTAAQIVAPHPGALSTTVFADRADATYAVGETVKLTLNAAQDSYVTVLDIGPTGRVTQLFPNAYQADNKAPRGSARRNRRGQHRGADHGRSADRNRADQGHHVE